MSYSVLYNGTEKRLRIRGSELIISDDEESVRYDLSFAERLSLQYPTKLTGGVVMYVLTGVFSVGLGALSGSLELFSSVGPLYSVPAGFIGLGIVLLALSIKMYRENTDKPNFAIRFSSGEEISFNLLEGNEENLKETFSASILKTNENS
jgi:hypothetical protein